MATQPDTAQPKGPQDPKMPDLEKLPKLPQTIFNLEKPGDDTGKPPRRP